MADPEKPVHDPDSPSEARTRQERERLTREKECMDEHGPPGPGYQPCEPCNEGERDNEDEKSKRPRKNT